MGSGLNGTVHLITHPFRWGYCAYYNLFKSLQRNVSRSLQCPRLTVHKHLVASLLLFYISLLVYLEPYITKRKLGPDYREYVSTLYEQGRRPWATSVSSSMPQHLIFPEILIFLNDKFSPSKNQTVVLLMTECLPPFVVYPEPKAR